MKYSTITGFLPPETMKKFMKAAEISIVPAINPVRKTYFTIFIEVYFFCREKSVSTRIFIDYYKNDNLIIFLREIFEIINVYFTYGQNLT